MEKGTKERINAAAASQGISAAEFIRQAIDEKLTGCNNTKEIVREPFFD